MVARAKKIFELLKWIFSPIIDDAEGCPHCGLTDVEHDELSPLVPCPICKRKGYRGSKP